MTVISPAKRFQWETCGPGTTVGYKPTQIEATQQSHGGRKVGGSGTGHQVSGFPSDS